MSEITKADVIDAARKIRDYCRQATGCRECPFVFTRKDCPGTACNLPSKNPHSWKIPGDSKE